MTPTYSLIIYQTAYDYTDYIDSHAHNKAEALKIFIMKLQDMLDEELDMQTDENTKRSLLPE